MTGDDSKARLRLTSRQLWVIFLVGFVATAGVGVASHFATDVGVQNRITVGSSGSGVEVTVTGDFHTDLSGDWATSDSVTVTTSAGNMTVSSPGAASAELQASDIEGTWTVVTNVDGTAATITINPDDKAPVTLGGTVDRFNFTSSMAPGDGQADFFYSGTSGSVNATVEGSFTDGTQYGAVDADNNVGLDVGVANSNGQVTFSNLPTSSHTVEVQELGTLFIREESPPHPKITNCTATVRFFETASTDPFITEVEDSDQDGEIDLTGLPVDEEFVANIQCSGYHSRTVILPDLSQQETVFMLNATSSNVTTVENRFTVEDNTGKFPPTSAQIVIQKAINRSEYGGSPSGYSWTNVAGDDIGADQAFVTDLEEESRYRIVVRNQQGETRVLGAYVPEVTGTIPLEIGEVSIGGDTQAGAAFGATMREHDDGSRDVQVVYFDSQDVTSKLEIVIYNESNKNDEILNTTIADPSQRHVETAPVPASAPDDVTYVVQVDATRDGAPDISDSKKVGDVSELFGDLNLDQGVLGLLGWVLWLAFTGFFALRSPVLAPAASVLLAVALTVAGVLFIDPVLLGIAGGIGVLVLVAGRDRP